MNYYETILIFDGRITEEKYKACIDHYIKKITEHGGLFRKKDILGKKKLAYSYKRDGAEIDYGWYIVFTYKGFPDIIPKLEEEYRADDTILKFMTIRRDPEEDELSEYAEVTKTEEEAKSPAESNAVESEQSSSGSTIDCWDKVFNLKGVS